ncbi:MAG: VOC family protein [Saprospiraceae bacterium]|nr:VOC family protein [Saprospiraceae bacterium]
MSGFTLQGIQEVVCSTGGLDKARTLFERYGGWNVVDAGAVPKEILAFWDLEARGTAEAVLLQSNHHSTGQLRLVQFSGVEQQYIRSSQQPWDTGGIMDINLRVHEVPTTFAHLRELGWHGLSDPLLQTMGPFTLYDVLMRGPDDTIVAFTHRLEPPMELSAPIAFPSHIYNSSIIVKNLAEALDFYQDKLGCHLLNSYQVKKDSPQENMFGLPFNFVTEVVTHAHILSFDGTRDTIFQIVLFEGVEGKDFASVSRPPNRGWLLYRVKVDGVEAYHDHLQNKGVGIHRTLQSIELSPYGKRKIFAVLSPNGVWWEFFGK